MKKAGVPVWLGSRVLKGVEHEVPNGGKSYG